MIHKIQKSNLNVNLLEQKQIELAQLIKNGTKNLG